MKKSYPQLERYHRMKDEINARKRAYRETHKAEVNLKAKVYRDTRREEIRRYDKAYAKKRTIKLSTASLLAELEKRRPCDTTCEYFTQTLQRVPCEKCCRNILLKDNFKPTK